MPAATVPVHAGLFASLDPPRLLGSRCAQCGTVTFPVAHACPRCSATDVSSVELPDRGTVWTWTLQGFQPKAPYVPDGEPFRPFPVAYVDLGDVLVESRMLAEPDQMHIGLPVQLTVLPVWRDGDAYVVTYAFGPVEVGG